MKKILVLKFFLLVGAFTVMSQGAIEQLQTSTAFAGYGRLWGAGLIFLGIDSVHNSISVQCTSITNGKSDKIVLTETYFPPIGWLNESEIIFFERVNDNSYIYRMNPFNKTRSTAIRVDSVMQPELFVVNDEEVVVFVSHPLFNATQKCYKYNFLSREKTLIYGMADRKIERIAFNKQADIVGFLEFVEGDNYVSILNSEKVIRVVNIGSEMEPEESPLVFSKDGRALFFVVTEEDVSILNKYHLDEGQVEELYKFEKGVRCLDMSISGNHFILTLKGMNAKKISSIAEDPKYKYELEIDSGIGIYLLSF